jgi:hypothetical protein
MMEAREEMDGAIDSDFSAMQLLDDQHGESGVATRACVRLRGCAIELNERDAAFSTTTAH